MKMSELISRVRKQAGSEPMDTILRVGDIITHKRQRAVVCLVNECRASVLPLGGGANDREDISPNSEVTVHEHLGVEGCIALLEKGPDKPAPGTRKTAVEGEDAPRLGKLGGWNGYTVVSVVRALGKLKWDFKRTREAFDRVGIAAADQTLRIQLKAGRDGNGTIAQLSKTELAVLKGTSKKAAKPAAEIGEPVTGGADQQTADVDVAEEKAA